MDNFIANSMIGEIVSVRLKSCRQDNDLLLSVVAVND